MPSDPRVKRALQLLAGPIQQYRSALATTLEEVRNALDGARSDVNSRARRLHDQFGAFGSRIDTRRLATALEERPTTAPADVDRLERASGVLRNLASRGDSLFDIEVPAGGDPAAAVRRQLAAIGRGFAAARIARAASTASPSGLDEERCLDAFPFAEWTAAERLLTPPIIVGVSGVDLVAGSLAPYLDGTVKLLLIVDGLCAPAPLVRLITPSTLVVQAHDFSDLEPLAKAMTPAVGALMPAWAARFTHDPSAGLERLTVQSSREWRIKRVGPFSPEQQLEELAQLEALSAGTRGSQLAAQNSAARGSRLGARESGDGAALLKADETATPSDVDSTLFQSAAAAISTSVATSENTRAASREPRNANPEPRAADIDRLAAWLLQQVDLSAVD